MQNVSLTLPVAQYSSPSHVGKPTAPLKTSGHSWEGAPTHIQGQNRANLLDVFSQVHGFLLDAMENIADGKDIPEGQKTSYTRWAHEIERAKQDPTAPFPVDEFAQETSQLCAMVGKSQKVTTLAENKQWYGGDTGGKIFNALNNHYFVPMVRSAIASFSNETSHLPYEERLAAAKSFFDHVLNISGFARHLIAVMNSSDRPEQMGIRRQPDDTSRMEDECEKDNYVIWRPAIKNQMASLVASHPDVQRGLADGKSLSTLVREQPATNGVHHLQLTADGHTVELAVDRTVDPPKCIGAYYARPKNIHAAHYMFDWAQDANGLVAINMWCHHPLVAVNNIVETAATEFEALCNWDGRSVDEFRDNIALLLYKYSNSSTFFAGQQAIMEKFLAGLTADKGVKMTVSPAWAKCTYDQQALMLITQDGPEKFIAAARQNIQIERL